MSKTGWTMTAATVLVVLSVALAATRRTVLGPDIDGPRGTGTWRVSLIATGDLRPGRKSLTLPLPPDFRRQHISQERFRSSELIARVGKGRQRRRQVVTWRRASVVAGRAQPFRLTYTFRCLMGTRRPTPSMEQVTRTIDAEPTGETFLKSSPLLEVDDPLIQDQARSLLQNFAGASKEERVRALFDFVAQLDTEQDGDAIQGARACLLSHAGDSGGKARLLVALCRSQHIPARLMTGLALGREGSYPLHHWAEAWVGEHWLPMCPINHHFGADKVPDTYLVLTTDDKGFTATGGDKMRLVFQVQVIRSPTAERDPTASGLRTLFLRASLNRLRPAEQHLIRFLLLLPLAALIVSLYRTLIGVPTFGTFSPALLGLAFLDLRALRWGLPIFVLLILVGWAMRHGLERFHLLQVPRAASLLTLIVALLIVLIVVSSNFGVTGTQYVSLFPLVILTHLVERFWTIEAEDGTMSSFKTLMGTMFVAVTVSLALGPDFVGAWMLSYPETLLVVLAAQLALGRYTGYRLLELYRFGELIQDEPPPAASGLTAENAKPLAAKEPAEQQAATSTQGGT